MSKPQSPSLKVGEVESKKRKAKEPAHSLSREKRLRSFYNDKYRELYNSVLAGHFHSSPGVGLAQHLSSSQIGSTLWTIAEKNTFFHVIARKGRFDLEAIAHKLQSKSKLEIGQYIELLRQGLVNAKVNASQSNKPLLLRPGIEAAFEISPACIASLDRAGAALSIFQQNADERLERKKHGKTWLLTPRIGHLVNRCLQKNSNGEDEIVQRVPEAVLLDLKCFLDLSKGFFMNSTDLEYNWTSYAEKSEKPGIMHSAFTDLHTLTVSTITRLVQSSLHFAVSRLKAGERLSDPLQRFVTEEDVATALKVLGMGASRKSYWLGIARRCKLSVSKDWRDTQNTSSIFSYNEIEDLLRSPLNDVEDQSTALGNDNAAGVATSTILDRGYDVVGTSEHRDGFPSFQLNEDLCSEEEAAEEEEDDKEEEQEQLHNASLESLDRKNSQTEERLLWELLDEGVVLDMDTGDDKDTDPLKNFIRQNRADLEDWTSWIDYGAEWETLQRSVPVEHFRQRNAAGGRRLRE